MSDWQSMETAPKDGTPFNVLDACGEVFVARYMEDGRICYRMHGLRCGEEYRIIDAEMDGKPVKAKVPVNEPWPEIYEHHWVIWTRGFEFQPEKWLPLPRPKLAEAA